MHRLLALTALALSACSRGGKGESARASTAQQRGAAPTDTLLITSGRLGQVRSCELLSEIRHAYPTSRDTLTSTESELKQAGVVVDLAPGERLLYVASWSDSSHAWTLSTTSSRFHTRSGLHVGSRYADVLSTGDSIEFSFPEGFVVATIVPERVSFMVDDHSATVFYSQYSDAHFAVTRQMMDSNATIVEFFTGRGCGK